MNVLSLFDGMSCGQLALNRIGIKYDNYYASEIDKYAISVTMANFPNTIQLGSVIDLDTSKLPKIDLLIGGSPCQSFSFAGKRKGMTTTDNIEILELNQYLELKKQNFQFEGQSYLFWEYMRILNEVKPKYFLLENVTMSEKWAKILSKAIGVKPILINSSLVSAQNRERLYWTNIGLRPKGLFNDLESIIQQPKDKKLILRDILQDNPNPKFYVSEKVMAWINKGNQTFKLDIRNENQKGKTVIVGGKGNTDLIREKVKDKYFVNLNDNQKDKFDKLNVNVDKSGTLTEAIGRGGSSYEYLSMLKRNSIITHNLSQNVKVRKNEVDISGLQKLLKKHKGKEITIDFISKNLDVPKTMVEHWFRKDSGFSIPNPEIWPKLKELLNIKTDEFDSAIMEFEEKEGNYEKANRVYDEDGKSPTLTLQSNNDKILSRDKLNFVGGINEPKRGNNNSSGSYRQQDRVYHENGKAATANTVNNTNYYISNQDRYKIRRLTPIECERLQTVPDNYTNHVSDTQRYKMLGNGWTIDVIAHIFSYIKK